MEKYYTVDGYGVKDGINIGREFYMGTSLTDAEHIYQILQNKIEPEYTELTNGIEYTTFYINK